jgi:hypothetical protein
MPIYTVRKIDDLPEHHRAEARRQLGAGKKMPKTEAQKKLKQAQQESLSRLFLAHWNRNELPKLETEYSFHPTRKWRLDYALPELKIAIEIHGGTRQNGRHNRAQGFANDREKMNEAQAMGWFVVELTDVHLHEGQDAMDKYLQPIKEILSAAD